jgi:hypothetical protein
VAARLHAGQRQLFGAVAGREVAIREPAQRRRLAAAPPPRQSIAAGRSQPPMASAAVPD